MLKKIVGGVNVLANRYLLPGVETLLAPKAKRTFKFPPVFILGAPRCGSTLIYQAITEAFDVHYITNRSCGCYGAPALADKLAGLSAKSKSTGIAGNKFTSVHGQTAGDDAPAECGDWWYRFFPMHPSHVTASNVQPHKMQAFRRSVLSLERSCGKPLIFKNLYASMRIQVLNDTLPEALYIVIRRNELDNAHSLLKGRKDTNDNYQQWWSLEPPNVEQLKELPPHQQVLGQIRGIYNTINADFANAGVDQSRVFTLEYESFCNNTHKSLSDLALFLNQNSIPNEPDLSSVPESFEPTARVNIDEQLYKRLKESAANKR